MIKRINYSPCGDFRRRVIERVCILGLALAGIVDGLTVLVSLGSCETNLRERLLFAYDERESL